MKLLVGIVLGVGTVLVMGGIYLVYRIKGYAESLNIKGLGESARRIPTIPMMDPDSFETANGAPGTGAGNQAVQPNPRLGDQGT